MSSRIFASHSAHSHAETSFDPSTARDARKRGGTSRGRRPSMPHRHGHTPLTTQHSDSHRTRHTVHTAHKLTRTLLIPDISRPPPFAPRIPDRPSGPRHRAHTSRQRCFADHKTEQHRYIDGGRRERGASALRHTLTHDASSIRAVRSARGGTWLTATYESSSGFSLRRTSGSSRLYGREGQKNKKARLLSPLRMGDPARCDQQARSSGHMGRG